MHFSLSKLQDLIFLPHQRKSPLSRWDLFRLKNWSIFGVLTATILTDFLSDTLLFTEGLIPTQSATVLLMQIENILVPAISILFSIILMVYERPIRRQLDELGRHSSSIPKLNTKAQRRLLNEPFFAMCLVFFSWFFITCLFVYILYQLGEDKAIILRVFFLGTNAGLITTTLVFFITEHVTHHHISYYLFPDGGISKVTGTIRIRILVRLFGMLFACSLIPLISFLQLYFVTSSEGKDVYLLIFQLRSTILTNSIFFIVVGIIVTILVGFNLALPLKQMIQVLRKIQRGQFDEKVVVTTNDEIGYTGDVINEMAQGLKDRERMRKSLDMAREIQQNLLPSVPPKIKGLDVAGRIIYCDETGGDYLDYFQTGIKDNDSCGILVGDVSGHGLQSALIMISARTVIHHHMLHNDNLADIISDANEVLYRDFSDSGNFMTMFMCNIQPKTCTINWVRAGHDPALVYDTATHRFESLTGQGMPLAVEADTVYQNNSMSYEPGQILVMGTDGIWERQSANGLPFGKNRLKELIQRHQSKTAGEILDNVLYELDAFCCQLPQQDDLTLVVVKL